MWDSGISLAVQWLDPALPLTWAWVQYLVRELRSHKLLNVTQKKKKKLFIIFNVGFCASLVTQTVKNLPAMQETQVQFLGREDTLEKGMATHSSILAWRIPWTEEPGGLQSTGSQRVGHY